MKVLVVGGAGYIGSHMVKTLAAAGHEWAQQVVCREAVARRKLRMLNNARTLDDLRVPPANRLEPLKGRRKGQYSIRINDQWRICFVWVEGGANAVEITDYH